MTLQGCRAKLRRAQEHVDTLEQQIRTFVETHRYRVVVDRQPNQVFVVSLDDPPIPPYENWALLIGDAIHNLRSALDYIAWELAGADPSDRNTMFPIFDTLEEWNTNAKRRIKRLPREAQALVQQMQPYHGGHPQSAALSAIRRLDDADKHKLLTVTSAVQEGFSVSLSQPLGSVVRNPVFEFAPNIPLEHKAVALVVNLSECSPDVTVDAEFTPLITFGEAWDIPTRTAVVPGMRAMLIEATTIADTFGARFFSRA